MRGFQFLPLIAIAVLFWLLIIRPQTRRQRELKDLQSSLDVGDAVVLTSGIFATVARTGEDRVDVEIAEGVIITVARGAIGIVNPPDPVADDLPDPTDEHDPNHEQGGGTEGVAPEEKN